MKNGKAKVLIIITVIFALLSVCVYTGDTDAYQKKESSQAELSSGGTLYSIEKWVDGKYYYRKAGRKYDKKTGWKKNNLDEYTYYVGSKGYVTEKIQGGYWYHWNGKKFVKKSLTQYKNKTKTINKKAFFVTSAGKITYNSGWKKVSGVYTYYVTSTGSVSVKLTGKKYYKFSSGAFKAQSLKKYKNDRIKVKGKYFYVDKNGSLVKNAKTVTYKGYKYTVKKNGTCSKTKVKTTTNPGSGNNSGSDTAGKKDTDKNTGVIPEHVHQWSPLAEDHTMLKDTNYVKHDAVTGKVWGLVTSEWTENKYEQRYICRVCGKQFLTDNTFDAEWDNHGHSSYLGPVPVVVETIVHPAVYGWVDTVITPAYTEWDINKRCTVCGETMKMHAVQIDFNITYTPEKDGELVDVYGRSYQTVKAGEPFKN